MIAQIITENGQKKIKPLTADAGAGAPVGSLISMYKKTSPSGYLFCDGSTFDETKYPALYQYLGSNVLPDYRECVAVGAEQNTTDTIATHDVYTEGQFKDDQLQDHVHDIFAGDVRANHSGTGIGNEKLNSLAHATSEDWGDLKASEIVSGRTGTTTHGKQKAVFVYIKATSGLSENAQDNVLATINENNSYSTTEHKTGKKWIDGKDIFRKTFVFTNLTLSSTTAQIGTINISISNITKTEEVVKRNDVIAGSSQQAVYMVGNGVVYAYQAVSSTNTGWEVYYTLEYTKTT